MAGGLTEGSVDKRLVTFRVPIELAKKICHKYGDGGDDTAAYLAALEQAVAGVSLTEEEKVQVKELREMNMKARIEKRAAHKAKKIAEKGKK